MESQFTILNYGFILKTFTHDIVKLFVNVVSLIILSDLTCICSDNYCINMMIFFYILGYHHGEAYHENMRKNMIHGIIVVSVSLVHFK